MKRGKKVLSVILSMTMAFSAVGAVWAASAAGEEAKPDYTGTSEATVNGLLSDANAFLQKNVWSSMDTMLNGSLVQTIYGLYPSLEGSKALIGLGAYNFTVGQTYKDLDPEAFADLAADASVSTESLAAYFADHPIAVSGDAFWASLTKATAPLLGVSLVGDKLAMALVDIDQLLKDLGIVNAPSVAYDFVNLNAEGALVTSVPTKVATLSGVKPNADLGLSLDSFFPGYDKMTPEELGTAIYNKFGKNMYNFGTTSVGEQEQPMVVAGTDGNKNACLVKPTSVVDYSALAAADVPDTLTVSITNLWTSKSYTAIGPNPYKVEGVQTIEANGTPLYTANNVLSDPANAPARIADGLGSIVDAQGNLLYANSGATTVLTATMDNSTRAEKTVGFLKDVLEAIQPDAIGTLLGAVRVLSEPQAQVDFLKFAVNLDKHLSPLLGTLTAGLGSMSVGYSIPNLTMQIQAMLIAMPSMTKTVTIDGQEKAAFDFSQLLNYIGTQLSIMPVFDENGEHVMKPDSEGKPSASWLTAPLGLDFSALGSDALPADMSNADTFMSVYHYLYDNLVGNKDNFNKLLDMINPLIPAIDLKSAANLLLNGQTANSLLEIVAPLLHEMVYPAVRLVDEDTGIVVYAKDGAQIPDGAVLSVEPVTDGIDFGTVEVAKYQAYRIAILKDGEAVQPAFGTVNISIPTIAEYDAAKTAVFTAADEGMEQASIQVKDGFYQFTSDTVGLVAVAETLEVQPTEPTPEEPTTAQPDNGGSTGNVSTGDLAIGTIAALTLLSGAAIVLLRKKKA